MRSVVLWDLRAVCLFIKGNGPFAAEKIFLNEIKLIEELNE